MGGSSQRGAVLGTSESAGLGHAGVAGVGGTAGGAARRPGCPELRRGG